MLFCKKITCNASACNQCEALYGIIPKGCMASSRRKPTRLRVITCSPAARLHTSRPRDDYMPSRRTVGLDKKSRSKERDFLVGEVAYDTQKAQYLCGFVISSSPTVAQRFESILRTFLTTFLPSENRAFLIPKSLVFFSNLTHSTHVFISYKMTSQGGEPYA